ncbi:hypothetical protein ACH5RR_007407 [Cinchona calisaya]|uniref:Leucine-rich repeat-containing N-terminal plant-type domain-containing protein n=1 Tax=Cinchona calisaya TaxID=153742 RepID=A0ABD3AS30_9GENT
MKTPSSSKFVLVVLSLSLFIFLSLPSTCLGAKAKCHSEDKKALLEIKSALNNPYLLASWTPETDCCHWYLLKCNEITGRVIELFISGGEISGQIPEAVTKLPYLRILEFRKLSNLTGQIPFFLTKIPQLEELTLSWTNLSGPVPSFLGQIKSLTSLDLSFNNLSGTIPPSLGNLKNLTVLHLDRNKLTGKIPESLLAKFKGNAPDIYLNHNMLTGTVPRSFGDLNFSYRIDLSRNRLEADVSFLFGKNKTVQFVDLSRNLFQFDFSKVEFSDNLIYLDLNHNKIFGSLPVGLTEVKYLQFLNVSYNRLCGEIPTGGTGRLQDRFDSYSYFHNRCLCGDPLPACKKK